MVRAMARRSVHVVVLFMIEFIVCFAGLFIIQCSVDLTPEQEEKEILLRSLLPGHFV